MKRTTTNFLPILVILLALCGLVFSTDDKISKMKDAIQKGIDNIQASSEHKYHAGKFTERFKVILTNYSSKVSNGDMEDADRHFRAQAMELLIDIYEINNPNSMPKK